MLLCSKPEDQEIGGKDENPEWAHGLCPAQAEQADVIPGNSRAEVPERGSTQLRTNALRARENLPSKPDNRKERDPTWRTLSNVSRFQRQNSDNCHHNVSPSNRPRLEYVLPEVRGRSDHSFENYRIPKLEQRKAKCAAGDRAQTGVPKYGAIFIRLGGWECLQTSCQFSLFHKAEARIASRSRSN